MTIKELLITGWWSERHQSNVRPLWSIALHFPLFVVYWPAKKFVDWMDNK